MPPRPDILYVITKASWGGAQRYVLDIASAMRAEGREVAVAYGEPGLLVDKFETAGIRTIAVPALGRDVRIGKDLVAFRALTTLLKQERPRVVHLNSSKAGLVGGLAARKARIEKIIFTAHGWPWNEDRSLPVRVLFRLLAWITVLLSHRTICVSSAMRRDADWMPFASGKLVVVKNAIAAPSFLDRTTAKKSLGIEDVAGPCIGMISELHPTKRVEDALQAIALLTKRHPEAILVVLGEGEERQKLESLSTRLELDHRVRFLGFIPEASQYLNAFDLFLHTSRSESFGFAVAEAGFAGLPVIATCVGGIPELIKHDVSGTLITRNNPHAIARAIARYLEHTEKAKEHGTALAARMNVLVSLPRMAKETAAYY